MGIAKVLMASSKSASSSYYQIQASQFAQNIIDTMRQNNLGLQNGTYASTMLAGATLTQPTPLCITSTCTPDALATFDLWQWETTLQALLPNASATITTASVANGNYDVTVSITWGDAAAQRQFSNDDSITNSGNATFQLETLL